VARMEVSIAGIRQPGEELLLQGEEELAGEHAQVRAELLALAASFGGSHCSRQYQYETISSRD
jgi:hypothetical protein